MIHKVNVLLLLTLIQLQLFSSVEGASLQLISFTATVKEGVVTLSWTTSKNNRGFDIERKDSIHGLWRKVGFIKGDNSKSYRFKESLPAGIYYYRLKQGNAYSKEIEVRVEAPKTFSLCQNYPNPFNRETRIKYQLPRSCHVKLQIHNVLGQVVKTLVDSHRDAGYYTTSWDGRDDGGREVVSGVYFCRMEAGGFARVNRVVLVR